MAPPAASHAPASEDQLRAAIGAAFFLLSLVYVVGTIARMVKARARLAAQARRGKPRAPRTAAPCARTRAASPASDVTTSSRRRRRRPRRARRSRRRRRRGRRARRSGPRRGPAPGSPSGGRPSNTTSTSRSSASAHAPEQLDQPPRGAGAVAPPAVGPAADHVVAVDDQHAGHHPRRSSAPCCARGDRLPPPLRGRHALLRLDGRRRAPARRAQRREGEPLHAQPPPRRARLVGPQPDRAAAMREEVRIKRLPRAAKLALIAAG